MSGIFAPLPVSNGQLPSSQGNLIVCPSGTNYYIKQVFLFNHNGSVETIQLFLIPNGGTATSLPQLQLDHNQSAQLLEDGESITLTPGDALAAATTTAPVVDYSITGIQET